MKIIFTANKLWDVYIFRGGVIKSLVQDGNKVEIFAPDDGRIDTEKELGAPYTDIKVDKRGVNPVNDLKLFLQLFKLYREKKPDLIFHYTIKPNIYGTMAAKILGIKSIAVLTGLGYSFVKGGLISEVVKLLYKIALSGAEEVWVLNSEDRDYLLKEKITSEKKLYILPGEGVDTEKFAPSENIKESKETVFLMIARAFYDKGFGEYEEAARRITKKYPEAKFKFLGALGEGNTGGVTEEHMEALEKEGVMEYLGITDDVTAVIRTADCLVLPSYREGISRVLLEAASMEKPLIATDVPGCRELIDDGINGFLVEPKSVDSLEVSLRKFIDSLEEEREKMGKKGREKVLREFDEKIIIDIYRKKVKKYGS